LHCAVSDEYPQYASRSHGVPCAGGTAGHPTLLEQSQPRVPSSLLSQTQVVEPQQACSKMREQVDPGAGAGQFRLSASLRPVAHDARADPTATTGKSQCPSQPARRQKSVLARDFRADRTVLAAAKLTQRMPNRLRSIPRITESAR
jgi:hypothetical protein